MQDESTTPYGYCKCGCGEKTKLAPQTVSALGYVKGEPYPWVRGHGHRKPKPYHGDGLCECGCGEPTPIARHTNGYTVAGHPLRFARGHGNRGPKIMKRYEVRDCGYETPCWVWLLARNGDGYGITNHGAAHRLQYVKSKGPIPAGLEIDHLCRIRACVNPDHLEAVTHAENIRRAEKRTAPNRCGACGQFLRKDSYYANRCSNCWGPEDEIVF